MPNEHIGVRGNLYEGVPRGLPGTYLSSFYETRPLPYAEAGYGFPETLPQSGGCTAVPSQAVRAGSLLLTLYLGTGLMLDACEREKSPSGPG